MQAEEQPPRLTDINEQISRIALYVLLITLAIAVLFPFYWMVMTSLKDESGNLYLSTGLLSPKADPGTLP